MEKKKKNWDVLPIFMKETIYHVRTEMRQGLGLKCCKMYSKIFESQFTNKTFMS